MARFEQLFCSFFLASVLEGHTEDIYNDLDRDQSMTSFRISEQFKRSDARGWDLPSENLISVKALMPTISKLGRRFGSSPGTSAKKLTKSDRDEIRGLTTRKFNPANTRPRRTACHVFVKLILIGGKQKWSFQEISMISRKKKVRTKFV